MNNKRTKIGVFTCAHLIINIIIILCFITTSSLLGYQIGATYLEIVIIFIGGLVTITQLGNKRILNSYLKCIIPIILFTVIEFIYYPINGLLWIRMVLLLCVSIGICIYADSRHVNIFKQFYYIVLIYTVLNLVVYSAVALFHLNLPYQVFQNDWLHAHNNYFYLLYDHAGLSGQIFGPFMVSRNEGIFTEPGVFAVLLDLELLIYYFTDFKKQKWHLIIILVALLSTISTTGLGLAILIIGFEALVNNKIRDRFSKVTIFLIGFTTAFVVIVWLLDQKLTHATASFDWRFYDWISGIELFIKKPLLGWGYRNHFIFEQLMLNRYGLARGNTNSISSVLYQLGIMGSMIYIVPLLCVNKMLKKQNRIQKRRFFFTVICIVLIVMSEPIIDSALLILILGYVYSKQILINQAHL